MEHLSVNCAKKLFNIFVIIICFINISRAQNIGDVEISPIRKFGSRLNYRCFIENVVYDEASFKKISDDKDCENITALIKPDFKTQTIIGFEAGSDCFVRANAKVFRNENEKKYKVIVKKIGGGCRASGAFRGLLTLEKIPSDYKIEFSEIAVDKYSKSEEDKADFIESFLMESSAEILEMRPINLRGCFRQKQFIHRNEKDFLSAIRNDASRDYCLKNLEKIDFNKYSLLGIKLTTDYCSIPKGIKYEFIKVKSEKQYLFSISYDDPKGSICRRLGYYFISVLVPKLEEDYEMKFDVKIIDSK